MRSGVRRVLSVLGLTAAVLLVPASAFAHPLGDFTVNLYAGIRLAPGEVTVDYVVDMAEIPTVQVMPAIDADGDGAVSDAEGAAWAAVTARGLTTNLDISVGGSPVRLQVASATARLQPGQGGLDVLRLEVAFEAASEVERGELVFRDANYPDRIGWREITAIGVDGTTLGSSTVPTSSVTNGLLAYPEDLLSGPLDVREATVSFEPGVAAPAGGGGDEATATRPGVAGGAFAGLVAETGPWMAVALLIAFGFGAMHALGPGHGKTLMATYLVGAGGRPRHAVAVGAAVAVMHTASVLAIGLVVLTATEVFAPERVYPWLGLGSGLVALGLGAGLLVTRLGAWGNRADHDHGDGHDHDHPHGHRHDVAIANGPVLSRRGLSALAVAGGILPSPTALLVLLAAVALDRAAYGLGLIAAFSLGLAAALVVVGLVALRARDAMARRMSSRFSRLMPVLSASAVAMLGLVLTVRGIAQI